MKEENARILERKVSAPSHTTFLSCTHWHNLRIPGDAGKKIMVNPTCTGWEFELLHFKLVKTTALPILLFPQGNSAWGGTGKQCPILHRKRIAVSECMSSLAFQDTAGEVHLKKCYWGNTSMTGVGRRSEKKQIRMLKDTKGMKLSWPYSVIKQEVYKPLGAGISIQVQGKIPDIIGNAKPSL